MNSLRKINYRKSQNQNFNEEIIKRQTVIDYTHCKRVGFHETCGSYFYKPEGDSCICFLNNNFVDLRGNLTVHSLLEMSNQEFLNNGNSSAKSFADLISTSNKQCDPYNGEKTANDTCEAIPNEIFQDYLVLTKAETQDSNDSEVSFSKSTRWGPAANHSVNGFQNVISVLMSNNWKYDGPDANIMNMFPPGNYTLTVRFYGNPNIWRRALVISSKSIDVKTTYRSNAFDIVALILGMILLFGSIALLELRYSITGKGQSVFLPQPYSPTTLRLSKPDLNITQI
ncbi:jg10900 [Pararge aegeria aegeria]|uniref:Jg10900 protein n=1 Tax=Pararge aegeria aegeria TaxID=348720 RepID=A0A8S4SHE7_9NEOP|nr:jg10900 [Pararge aegeria aegeria]